LNISANLKFYAKILHGVNQRLRGRFLMKKVVSIYRSLWKREGLRFPADYTHPLSCESLKVSAQTRTGLGNQKDYCHVGQKYSQLHLEIDQDMDTDTDTEKEN
jgi:hypothetical protein